MNTMSKKATQLTLATLASMSVVMSVNAGIVSSKHDLSSTNTTGATAQAQSTSGEVCVFCHTPHGSDKDAAVPLWNKNLNTSASYTRYSSLQTSTLDGAETSVGSVSLACLSCHDGTQAMDVLINKPGSGGYTATGAQYDTLAVGAMTGFAALGSDLANDHPVSIQYAGGGLSSANSDGVYTSAVFGDKDFKDVRKKTINSVPVWWVDSDADGVREKTEMQLYTRNISGTTQPSVECASCHDPHNDATAAADSVSFLRIANTGSAVCLACHNK